MIVTTMTTMVICLLLENWIPLINSDSEYLFTNVGYSYEPLKSLMLTFPTLLFGSLSLPPPSSLYRNSLNILGSNQLLDLDLMM